MPYVAAVALLCVAKGVLAGSDPDFPADSAPASVTQSSPQAAKSVTQPPDPALTNAQAGGAQGYLGEEPPVPPIQYGNPGAEQPWVLKDLQNLQPQGAIPSGFTDEERPKAMRSTAEILGMQAGVRWRYHELNKLFDALAPELDDIFDFQPLMVDGGKVVPPVIVASDGGFRLTSSTTATASLSSYYIALDARIAATPPSWRDYLYHEYPAFTRPNDAIIPKTDAERQLWIAALNRGWRAGVEQAEELYHENLALLERDYLGMLRFKELALQGVVNVPLLAEGKLGITVEGRQLSIDERLFKITVPTGFQRSEYWHPVIQIIRATPALDPKAAPSFIPSQAGGN